MCEPISAGIAIGAATGAAGAAITGGDPLQGAIMGGITGGFTGGLGGFGGGGTLASIGQSLGATPGIFINSFSLNTAALAGFGATSLASSVALGMLTPQQQDYSQYYNQAGSNPIAYNTQQNIVTGSGGRQAAAVLASEIKQAKKVRQRQAEEATGFGLGMDLAGTGLQIA